MTYNQDELDNLSVRIIRGLAIDGPEEAGCGHPGTAMALAPLAHVLFSRIMHYDASDPKWPNRDRFVLSCGHASILLYSMLYLSGFGLEIEDLKEFRKFGSLTPGHPEVGHTTGVEVTTGPLGQGIGNSVGLAISERYLRSRFGREVIDHRIYTICSDGDLMEGISHEAASLAGHLGLDHLTMIYDDNHITIDGPTEIAYTDDVPARFRSYGWQVIELGEASEDLEKIESAILEVQSNTTQPSLIVLRSHIGFPSPHFTDTSRAHGEPLGKDETRLTKEILGLPVDQSFYVPQNVLDYYRSIGVKAKDKRTEWQNSIASNEEFKKYLIRELGQDWSKDLPVFEVGSNVATRKAVGACVEYATDKIPTLIAGSADLAGNTGVKLKDGVRQDKFAPSGRQIEFGIREHAMGAIMNGIALHGNLIPIGGTFFVFSDYMKPSIRLAALSNAHVIYSFTHDSIGLGEDGPTHQPVEHLAALRAVPNLRVIRPADANEMVEAFRLAIELDGPTALIGSRQDIPVLAGTYENKHSVRLGAYTLYDEDSPDIILVASGSEVSLIAEAKKELNSRGVSCRVVSMPSWDLFEENATEYKTAILPKSVPKLGVEALSSLGWHKYVDDIISLDRFGSSAKGSVNFDKLGFNIGNVVKRATDILGAMK